MKKYNHNKETIKGEDDYNEWQKINHDEEKDNTTKARRIKFYAIDKENYKLNLIKQGEVYFQRKVKLGVEEL